jgi:4-amino-4-deoxy-L-arabinose transferase-like glycosyltransferase
MTASSAGDIPAGTAGGNTLHWLIRSPVAYALILLFGLALYLPGLRTIPAIDRDEARFAQATRQMGESGDYVDIRLGTEARLKKPVGIYWLQAAATKLAGGEDIANPVWTYRLPSLVGALGAILITLAIGRRWLGAEAGFAGAAILAATLLLNVEARQAKTDAFLLLTILAAMAGLAEAWMPDPAARPMSRMRWISFWVAIGIGILVKGPIILMVVVLTAAILAIHRRGLRWMLRLRPWPGIAIALAICLPWLIAITISSHGAFITQSLGGDMAAKLTGAKESHGAPPGAYLAMFPVIFWPGSLFALLALPWVWRNRRDRAVIFCLAWIIPSWLVFEAVPTKLPHYVLPLFPAIALLAGTALSDRLTPPAGQRHWWPRIAVAFWTLVGLALGALVIAAAPLGDGRLSIRGVLAAVAIWAITAGGAWSGWRGERRHAAGLVLVSAIVAWGITFGAAIPALDAPWIAPRLRAALFEKLPAGHGPVLIAGYSEPSALIALGSDTQFGGGGDAAKLLARENNAVAIVSDDQADAFLAGSADAHIATEPLGSVAGFNYAKGKRVTLTLYRRTPQ